MCASSPDNELTPAPLYELNLKNPRKISPFFHMYISTCMALFAHIYAAYACPFGCIYML